jgi:uncharacterized protein (DUF2141 family)
LKILFLILSTAATMFTYCSHAQGKITVQVFNLKNDKGVTRICLYNNAAAFNGEGKPVQCIAASLSNKNAMAVFENIPAGTYAISLFHDVNNNNKLDLNFVGIPKEGYGASQNKLPFASAPSFKENQFTIKAGQQLQLPIRLRYL